MHAVEFTHERHGNRGSCRASVPRPRPQAFSGYEVGCLARHVKGFALVVDRPAIRVEHELRELVSVVVDQCGEFGEILVELTGSDRRLSPVDSHFVFVHPQRSLACTPVASDVMG